MKQTKILMGMPIIVEVVDSHVTAADMKMVFDYFRAVDKRFSTYKKKSEISQINNGSLKKEDASDDMKEIFELAEKTKQETQGYFDIFHKGTCDPSGLVKGWAIAGAAQLLQEKGFQNFSINVGGDMHVSGKNRHGQNWRIGIQHPEKINAIVKVITGTNMGVATSGTYIRGQHIYNPKRSGELITDVVSLTVIGPNIFDADRFATAAFAMGRDGIHFIEQLKNFEGYMIDKQGIATYTSGFERYVTC